MKKEVIANLAKRENESIAVPAISFGRAAGVNKQSNATVTAAANTTTATTPALFNGLSAKKIRVKFINVNLKSTDITSAKLYVVRRNPNDTESVSDKIDLLLYNMASDTQTTKVSVACDIFLDTCDTLKLDLTNSHATQAYQVQVSAVFDVID